MIMLERFRTDPRQSEDKSWNDINTKAERAIKSKVPNKEIRKFSDFS
jgi:hypothetical protein